MRTPRARGRLTPAPFAIPARCSTCAWLRGCVPVWWLVVWWLGFAVVAWVCCGGWWYVSGVVVARVVFDMSSCVCCGVVACFRWWLGGNCYHRRCFAACRRRVGGLWSQNPPRGCSKCRQPRWNAGDMGCLGCSGLRFGRGGWVGGGVVARLCAGGSFRWLCWLCSICLRVFVVVVWLVFVGGLGGIATIGAALRRVVGVSGVYGRKTPRVVAQSAGDLGGMRVTWGVWGVVDYGLGVVVRGEAFLWCGVSGMSGLSACCRDDRAHCRRLSRGAVVGLVGEWWPVCAQAGPLGGSVGGVPGLPLVGLTCA